MEAVELEFDGTKQPLLNSYQNFTIMKKSVLLSLAFFLFCLSANAQFTFGIKGSLNKSTLSGNTDDATKMEGLGFSILFYKKVNKFLEVGIEPGIVLRGTTQPFGRYNYCLCCFGDCILPYYPEEPEANFLQTSYIQAPIMARANVPIVKDKLILFGKFGSGVAWLNSGYYETSVYDEVTFLLRPENKTLDFSGDHSFKRWDWGLNGAIGLGAKVGCGLLSFETELYRGLSNMTDYGDNKNRTIGYSLGYSISL